MDLRPEFVAGVTLVSMHIPPVLGYHLDRGCLSTHLAAAPYLGRTIPVRYVEG